MYPSLAPDDARLSTPPLFTVSVVTEVPDE